MKTLEKILNYIPGLIKASKFITMIIECVRLDKTNLTNEQKHSDLKKFINNYLNPIQLDITDKQVDILIVLMVKILNFKRK